MTCNDTCFVIGKGAFRTEAEGGGGGTKGKDPAMKSRTLLSGGRINTIIVVILRLRLNKVLE